MRSSRSKTIGMVAVLVVPLLATIFGGLQVKQKRVTKRDIALLGFFYILTQFGVTVGFHRYLTHRSFKAPKWLEVCLVTAGALSWQGRPIKWVADHRKHHTYTDRKGDPHSPKDGWIHSHFGWLFTEPPADQNKFAQDMLDNPRVVWVSKRFGLLSFLSMALPFAIGALGRSRKGSFKTALTGGLSGLLWGGLIRIFLVHHVTWSINSVCHIWGYRSYKRDDESRNFWPLWLVSAGEGFHNNHHEFPRSAFHGIKWYEFDPSGWFIRILELLRLAKDVKRPVLRKVSRNQDQAG